MWTSFLNFNGFFYVDSDRRSGGKMFLWRDPFDIFIQSYSSRNMDCIVKQDLPDFMLICNPMIPIHYSSWKLFQWLAEIYELKKLHAGLWEVGISMISYLNLKKFGALLRSISQTQAFSDALEDCGLKDLKCKGDPYTWCNKHQGDDLFSSLVLINLF